MNDEVAKSILSNIQDRTVSPLFGAFAISWTFWNYKLVLAMLAFIPLSEKIDFIEKELYPDWLSSAGFLFAGPAITSLLFLFIYPFPAKWVFRFWRLKQKELRDIRFTIENESLLTVEESKRIRKKVLEMQTEYESQIRDYENDIALYKEEIAATKKNIATKEQQIVQLTQSNKEAENIKALHRMAQDISNADIEEALTSGPYRLQFNPKKNVAGGSKVMMFGPSGKILEGANQNESSWKINDAKLELFNNSGELFSRFRFDPKIKVFLHTNDPDTQSIKSQYMLPASDAA